MTEDDDLHLEDSSYLFVEEVINNTKPYGIYLFGLNGSHQDRYFYLDYSDSISIIKTLRLEDILISISFYFKLNPSGSFEEKIKYYSSIVEIMRKFSSHPWQIKPDNPISNELGILDTISRKDLSVSGVWIGLKKSVLLTSFGKPDSIVSHINEFEGTSGYQYYYKSSSFHIENDKFSSFDLKDDSFYLDFEKTRVGESIDKIKHLFC